MPNLQDGRSSSAYQYSASSFAATPIGGQLSNMAPLAMIQGVNTVVGRPAGRSPSPPPVPPHYGGPGGVDPGPVPLRGPAMDGDGAAAIGLAARSSSPPLPTVGGRASGIPQHHQQQQQQHNHHHHQSQPPQQQLLPPTCGARQLSKLKRFLTTLQQFAVDISPETGEHVRSLILALVNSQLSVEEFHAKLQQATNFPLRPFVIPFLKANLPLLQREMLHCAQLARQSPHQYVATYNDRILLNAAVTPSGSSVQRPVAATPSMTSPHSLDLSRDSPLDQSPVAAVVGEKRRSPMGSQVSKVSPSDHIAKRPRTALSARSTSCSPPPIGHAIERRCLDDQLLNEDIDVASPLLLIKARDVTDRKVEPRCHDNDRGLFGVDRDVDCSCTDQITNDLKHVENLLQGIVGMVDQCKMAVGGLREQWKLLSLPPHLGDSSNGINQRAVADAVNEVKCKAIAEIRKVMAESEAKTERLVAAERARLEDAVAGARQQAIDEILQTMKTQQHSAETCWNCGRKATETCSGCNIACYCGPFCQHRDWVSHQLVCRRSSSSVRGRSPAAGSRSPSTPSKHEPIGCIGDRFNKRISEAPHRGDDDESAKTGSCSPRSASNDVDDEENDDAGVDQVDRVKSERLH